MAVIDEFQHIERRFFGQLIQLHPGRAAEMGHPDAATQMPSGSPDIFDAQVKTWEASAAALQALDSASLTEEQRLDVELVANEAQIHRLLHDRGAYDRAGRDPAVEVGELLYDMFSRPTLAPEIRVEGLLARLQAIPEFLTQARGRYRAPVAEWTLAAQASVEDTCGFLDEVVAGIPAILGEPGQLVRDDPRGKAAEIAAESAKVALQDFGAWLAADVVPRSDSPLALGPEVFEELIRLRRLGTDVAGLRAMGAEAYATLEAEYEAELKSCFPAPDVAGAEARWLEEVPDTFPEILEMIRDAVAASRTFVVDQLKLPLPGAERLEVIETPGFLQTLIPSAAYFDPPRLAEGPQVGIYMVTPGVERSLEHTPGMIYNVSTHEGYPGHHLQLAWANRQPSLFRAWVSGDEFCEGWAHYCEEMMTETGFAPVPGMRAAQLKDAAFRAVRIKIDIAIQTGELALAEAAQVLASEGRTNLERAKGEVAWYSFSPGYPLGYLTGKVLLKQIRAAQEASLGSQFDLGGFHRTILEGGTMPLWAHARRVGVEF